ncbi:hypothetical protein D3C85_1734820 [compost metagenome]
MLIHLAKSVPLYHSYPFHQSHVMDIADRRVDILAHALDQHEKSLNVIYSKVRLLQKHLHRVNHLKPYSCCHQTYRLRAEW